MGEFSNCNQVHLEGIRINEKAGGPGYEPNIPIRVAVHDPMSVADMIGTGFDVNTGYVSTILITPSQIVTSEHTKHLSRKERQCQFRDEFDKTGLFKDYSEANCNFECLLRVAYDDCGCMPWDYPHLNSSMVICDRWGRHCFKRSIIIHESEQKCKCQRDCTTTQYSYSVSQTKIDDTIAVEICSDETYKKLMKHGKDDLQDYNMPPKFISHYEQIMYGKDISDIDWCIDRVKKLAIVNFQIWTKIMTKIKRTQRVSFADTLANIGN